MFDQIEGKRAALLQSVDAMRWRTYGTCCRWVAGFQRLSGYATLIRSTVLGARDCRVLSDRRATLR